jgi:hypothetical protein
MSTENVPARAPSDDELRELMMYRRGEWTPRPTSTWTEAQREQNGRHAALLLEDRFGPAYWTPERIVAAMLRWARRYGRVPELRDWQRPLGNGRYLTGEWRPASRPAAATVKTVIGSWGEAIRLAGFDTQRDCESCGEAFAPPMRGGRHARFCSKLCRDRASYARRHSPPEPRSCESCGTTFTPHGSGRHARFCSTRCNRRGYRVRRARRSL